ncbi:energy transducer TonB [Alteromonas sediminis]|uniref:Energy transducer TonB n=1 Tax=Alteromonas sediminis TaxID=2259342 RepID=A0A3N5Z9F4_9ALTE|nr:energy transducer TonB [Alteromonas sediminis]RPJ65858.1 energy transducer TonB [Alteromonas sediminis]
MTSRWPQIRVNRMSHAPILITSDRLLPFRLLVAAAIGIVVAGLLTLFMHVLIAFSQQELIDTPRANMLDFVRIKREESSQRKAPRPQRPKTQEAPPAPPTPQSSDQSMSETALQVSMPTASADVGMTIGTGIGTGDGEYLPIVKVAPTYPIKAAAEGKEGECLVVFTVTTTGATKDVETVEGSCPPIFARSSIMAAKKFKYKPRVVDGKPIEVPGIYNLFNYTLVKRESQE